jgi:hypothetical protein
VKELENLLGLKGYSTEAVSARLETEYARRKRERVTNFVIGGGKEERRLHLVQEV